MYILDTIKLNEENIRTAIEDYDRYTTQHDVIEDVSDTFIHDLAVSSTRAKTALRELFRKSPAWDEDLQAIVINGTRTHDPDPETIMGLVSEILNIDAVYPTSGEYQAALYDPEKQKEVEERVHRYNDYLDVARFFAYGTDSYVHNKCIGVINKLAPKAYVPGKKLSRVFISLCEELGVANKEVGSKFQRLYAKLADELSGKKIDFKLFVSINPAHFITMSNPKCDRRGSTLTSCHSFNSTEYSYNNGCTGYARDEVTFIVFTVADPTDRESLNNRKTTRQIFAYKPGNGLLLQSRLYNTSGGTRGAQEESKVYRDLLQREISDLEEQPNLWNTYRVCGGHEDDIRIGRGFGGYADWETSDFDAKVSIRKDKAYSYEPLVIGTYGLCAICGDETDEGAICDDCRHENQYWCEWCEEWHDSTTEVHDSNGNWIDVCDSCLEENFIFCEHCNEYYPSDCCEEVDGIWVCRDCVENECEVCAECGELHFRTNMIMVNRNGDNEYVCDDCLEEKYTQCDMCGEYCRIEDLNEVHNSEGDWILVCDDCLETHFGECQECGERWPLDKLIGEGLCPKCANEQEESA